MEGRDILPSLPHTEIQKIIDQMTDAQTNHHKGKALEDLISLIFSSIPGVEIAERNEQNVFRTEEVDIALWNEKSSEGFYFLPNIVLIECKNWSNTVGSQEVSYFSHKLESRSCEYGILIAVNGITGNNVDLTCSHSIISQFLSKGIRVIVIRLDELVDLETSEDLVTLMKQKLLELTLKGANS